MMSMPTVVFFALIMSGIKNEKCNCVAYYDIIKKCDFLKNSFFTLIKYCDSS